MDSQGGKYFTNLLYEDSNFHDLIFMDSQDQMGQNLKQNTQVPDETTQFSPQMESTAKRSHGGNFTIDEVNLILSTWFNTSLDAMYRNEQKHKTYWSRVYEYFHKHKTFNHECNVNSLMHRWSTIQLGTNKFCGCFAQIESRHQSGINEQDKISQAKLSYQELHKNTINRGDDYGSHDAFVDLERPIGRKAEKERIKKRKSGNCMTLPLTGILTEIKEDNKKNSEKKIEILEKA
ncbi:uncharacterized protein LOC114286563 [Camellia sinensis]|uniref:uncharacterized protein LOC114286563 n=1 Tax=Camellia sinensis TaxID=4442 RepID=UPI0010358AF7|nr:uncharacterized protein LOC114286563 [Camellia sinensis]